MTDLTKLHASFWDFRRMMEPYWSTPDTLDSARFAKTEAAEVLKENGLWEAFVAFAASRQAQIKAAAALDTVLRRNISYSRNRVRDNDELDELADLAMMLLTAMGESPITSEETTTLSPYWTDSSPIDAIVHVTGNVHLASFDGAFTLAYVRRFSIQALALIDRYPGMNLPARLQARMARIYRKHHPVAGKEHAAKEGVAGWETKASASAS